MKQCITKMMVNREERKTGKSVVLLMLPVLLAACGGAATPAASDTVSSAANGSRAASASPKESVSPSASMPASETTTTAAGEPLNIITTYSILGDVVQNVGGGFIALRTLVGAGGDAHTYEPTPADSVALADADVVFENGLAFETWLDGLYESARSRAARVVVTEGITPITVAEHEDEHSDEAHDDAAATAEAGAHDDEHDHGEFDPHVWHDVEHIMHMTERVRDALAQADPANAQTYRANADAYMEQLQELDRLIREQVNTLLPERRKLVTTHDTFGYFAERYGFQVVGTALGSVSTEAADPSAQEIAILVEEIKAAGVPAIFAETITDNGLMERIAQEAGVELAPTLYTDALGEPGSDGATYIGMMRANVATIVEALSD